MSRCFSVAYEDLVGGGRTPLEGSFLVVSIGGEFESWFVGIDDQLRPSVLVRSEVAVDRQPAPIKLANLDVQFHVPCKIERANADIADGTCSVMRLNTGDHATREVFFSVCDSIALMLGDSPKDNELSSAMRRLAEIFRRMLSSPTRKLSGLFGELCLIHQARLPHELIRDWREDDADRYDFSSNDLKVEVKSTSTRGRTHEFSFDQCSPPAGSVGLVASLFVERAGRGTSIRELQVLIETRVASRPDSIFKLREIIAKTLGSDQQTAENARFDLALATDSILFFGLNEIPALRDDLPPNVSRVRFASDLSATQKVDIGALSNSEPCLVAYLKKP